MRFFFTKMHDGYRYVDVRLSSVIFFFKAIYIANEEKAKCIISK